MGATGTKPSQLAPKEIGGCSAPRWSGLGLVGKHSRTEHGQLTRGRPAYPRRRAERSTSGPPDGVLAKDRSEHTRCRMSSSPSTPPMGDHGFDAKRAFLHRGPKGDLGHDPVVGLRGAPEPRHSSCSARPDLARTEPSPLPRSSAFPSTGPNEFKDGREQVACLADSVPLVAGTNGYSGR